MIRMPGMLLIGSSGRNSGKTHLACAVIKNNIKHTDIIGLKVTTIVRTEGKCPRGGEGCGVCSSVEGDFSIIQEEGKEKGKDTALLLKAGAKRVFWLRVMEERLKQGFEALLERIPKDIPIVAESNRLRLVVEPGLFLMVANSSSSVKDSALQVWHYADRIIRTDGQEFDYSSNHIVFSDNQWLLTDSGSIGVVEDMVKWET